MSELTPMNIILLLVAIVAFIHWLIRWYDGHPPTPVPGRASKVLFWRVRSDNTLEEIEMPLVLKAGETANLKVTYTDAFGNPAPVDGEPVWAVTGTEALVVDPGGLTATVSNTDGVLKVGQVTALADSTVGPETTPLLGTLDYQVIAGNAVKVAIEVLPATPPAEPVA